jgi:hypothetical protein
MLRQGNGDGIKPLCAACPSARDIERNGEPYRETQN